ncbi:MAG: hypothetical protein J7J44_07040 [Deltaproteobacteria bacterium]|nr:hypothetical protein [Deltaproteobacteria bacterium]
MYRVGVDIGGTFTDIFLFNEDTGEIIVKKVPSTKRPEEAVAQGLKGFKDKDIKFFIHGTTIGTNAVLEHKGARTGMITTKGFRDIIEIGRQSRGWPKPNVYDFTIERPKPLAERHLRFEVLFWRGRATSCRENCQRDGHTDCYHTTLPWDNISNWAFSGRYKA